jgi:TolB-like protein
VQAILSTARAKRLDRVAAAYAVAGWLLVQASSIVLPTFGTPVWALRSIIAIAFIGFPVALFVAWFSIPHPRPDAIQEREGLTPGEYMLIGLLAGVLLLSLAQLAYEFTVGTRSATAPNIASSSLAPGGATSSLRVAILPFDAVGSGPEARAFADTLADEVISVLSSNGVEVVSRADSAGLRGPSAAAQLARLGVGLVLDGIVRSDGKTLNVKAHVEDARAHATLWSRSFDAPLKEADQLQAQVASLLSHMAKLAASPALDDVRNDPVVVANSLEVLEGYEDNNIDRALALSRDMVARAPNSSLGRANLAWSIALAEFFGLPSGESDPMAEVERQASLALKLNPRNGFAYTTLGYITPRFAWRRREELFLKGIANGDSRWSYSLFLLSTGRIRDALAQAQLLTSGDPLWPQNRARLASAFALAGRFEDATKTLEDAKHLWPHSPDVAIAELQIASWTTPARAQAMWNEPTLAARWGQNLNIEVWRDAIAAIVSHDIAAKSAASRRLAVAAENGSVQVGDAIATMGELGDLEGALHLADRVAQETNKPSMQWGFGGGLVALFAPVSARLRSDHRFMVIADRLGLVDYWRTSGHWPDFCSQPDLSYDCRAEVTRLAKPMTK